MFEMNFIRRPAFTETSAHKIEDCAYGEFRFLSVLQHAPIKNPIFEAASRAIPHERGSRILELIGQVTGEIFKGFAQRLRS
jgi:hypothetical protein